MDVFDEDAEPFDLSRAEKSAASAVSAESPDELDEVDDYDLEDATEDEIDFVIELHREDGVLAGSVLSSELANDLDEMITQLQRIPGDAGATGFVSVDGEFFVICRVRGRMVQVLLSDAGAANDWPLARDVLDYLGEDIPDEDEDTGPAGDLNLFVDSGLPAFDLEQMASNYDDDSDEVVATIARKLLLGTEFERLVEAYDNQ